MQFIAVNIIKSAVRRFAAIQVIKKILIKKAAESLCRLFALLFVIKIDTECRSFKWQDFLCN